MTTYPARVIALALSAAAVATTVAAVTGPSARAREAPGPRTGLDWRPCAAGTGAGSRECAELSVPVDYRDPRGERLTVAVTRLVSDRPAARRGTLLLIPGGPGNSGTAEVARKGPALRAELGGAYDIVGLDPRGTGGSTGAACGLPAEDRRLVNLRPWPAADGSIAAGTERARRTAGACGRDGGPVLRSISTLNEVRDIESFRRALGVERLSAVGTSYGAYAGAVYAQKYPHRTDRWVLDSSGDPDPARVGRGWLANMARGAEDRFPDYAAWASDPAREGEGLRLADRAEEVRPLFLALAAELDRAPKESATPGVPLTGNLLRQAMQTALHSDTAFPGFTRLLSAARTPGAKPVLPAALVEPLTERETAVAIAVVCNDVKWPGSVQGYGREVAADRARHPLTAGMPVNITACAFWKNDRREKPVRITDRGPSNILMIQNLRDPATPYSGALRMREALGERARLVSVDRGGHGVYPAAGSVCGNRAVTGFLTTGERPARDLSCPA
ncbi:alpha/beta hydrolase [Streptomyces sp. CAU 1734]|uniref:alpha/beta hydrolase n=1 Tax=Streptomyces sp. CAU 1734 TaxID=3140360 RepID=UPI0032600924